MARAAPVEDEVVLPYGAALNARGTSYTVNWKSSDIPDPEGYAAVFEKRAAEYDYAMKFAPRARDAEFTALDKSCSNELHEAPLIEVRLESSGVSSIN